MRACVKHPLDGRLSKRFHLLVLQLLIFLVVRVFEVVGVAAPQVRRQVPVRSFQGLERGFQEVSFRSRMPRTGGVAIFNTSKLQQLFGGSCCHQPCSSRCRNQTHSNTSALSCQFGADGVRSTEPVAPVSSTNGDEAHFGGNDGAFDGVSYFRGGFPPEPDVAVVVPDRDEGLEAGSLTGRRLLLHGHDTHDLVFQSSRRRGFTQTRGSRVPF